ncbi:hypothetical protein ACVV2G_00655 [Streptomyces ziwulingensis]
MRKALIQTTAYWEMRHIDPADEAAWAAVISASVTTRQYIRDTSTGIAKQRAVTLIGAWNHALDKGYGSGRPRRDLSVDEDKYNAWKQAYDSETYALTSVALIHRWDIDGKPGGDDDSPALRQPTLATRTRRSTRSCAGTRAQVTSRTRKPRREWGSTT